MNEQELKQAHLEAFLSMINKEGYGKDKESILGIFSSGIDAGFSIYKDLLLPEMLFNAWMAGETFGANYVSPFCEKDQEGSKRSFQDWFSKNGIF